MTTTVDQQHRIRLSPAKPEDRFWIVRKPEGRFELIPQPKAPLRDRFTTAQVRAAIRRSGLTFTRTWEQMREDTREP